MLHELDTALRSLVQRELGDSAEVEIDFDAPTKDWASRRNRPTIDIYLYDIRQDLTRSQFGNVEERRNGTVVRRRPQPKFFRLAYLVTAWTQRAEDEHRLLSALLVAFLRHEIVPPELLSGSVEQLGLAVPMAVALPPPQDRSLSDVWSALGGELKPSLDLILIAPLLPERGTDAGPPVTREPILTFLNGATGTAESQGGRVVPEDHAVNGRLRPPPTPGDGQQPASAGTGAGAGGGEGPAPVGTRRAPASAGTGRGAAAAKGRGTQASGTGDETTETGADVQAPPASEERAAPTAGKGRRARVNIRPEK